MRRNLTLCRHLLLADFKTSFHDGAIQEFKNVPIMAQTFSVADKLPRTSRHGLDGIVLLRPLCFNGTNMNLIRWIKSWLTHRGKALSLYRAGMAKANHRDYHGAIADYSDAIRAPNIPIDVKAMAIYNRALAYTAINEDEKAAEDLAAMLEMPGLSENIKTEARHRRERIKRRNKNTDSP